MPIQLTISMILALLYLIKMISNSIRELIYAIQEYKIRKKLRENRLNRHEESYRSIQKEKPNQSIFKKIGDHGEDKIRHFLQTQTTYLSFHDILLPISKSEYVQIDHAVITPYGVFVLETKHYSGTVYGKENDFQWTHQIRKSTRSFYNPVWQNRAHLASLHYILHDYSIPCIGLVVFTGKAKLHIESDHVIMFEQLPKQITEGKNIVLTDQQQKEIAQKIQDNIEYDNKKREEHLRGVKEKQYHWA